MKPIARRDTTAIFAPVLRLWDLEADGLPIETRAARLLPVRRPDGALAMLKIALEEEERHGAVLMRWWDGRGAARVLAAESDAILLERATGKRALADWARTGRDDEATVILCDAIAALHAPRGKPPPDGLVPLARWFRDLAPAAQAHGGWLREAERHANRLLAEPCDVVPLHGDLHHDNVLDFRARGWLGIDPKRLLGERGFDYAILFCNPDLADARVPVATDPERFRHRLAIVAARSGLPTERLLAWIVAWCGLSAAWFLGDEDRANAAINETVAAMALAALDGGGRR